MLVLGAHRSANTDQAPRWLDAERCLRRVGRIRLEVFNSITELSARLGRGCLSQRASFEFMPAFDPNVFEKLLVAAAPLALRRIDARAWVNGPQLRIARS